MQGEAEGDSSGFHFLPKLLILTKLKEGTIVFNGRKTGKRAALILFDMILYETEYWTNSNEFGLRCDIFLSMEDMEKNLAEETCRWKSLAVVT